MLKAVAIVISSGGGGGGSISTITSMGGTINVTNPTGPTTNIEVASGASGVATQYSVTQTAHGLSVGNIVRFNGTNYVTAQADSAADAEVIGIVSIVSDVDHFTLLEQGEITTLSGLTAGTTYFLSDATPGLLTSIIPTTPGSVNKPLLICTSSSSGVFNNMRGEIISGSSTTVSSVSNSDGTLIISPTIGDVVASLNLASPNLWQAQQAIPGNPIEYTFNGV